MKSREQIQKQYNDLIELRGNLLDAIKKVDALKISNEMDTYKYRINSACRVLDFLRSNIKNIKPNQLETYLVHCMNKLNGNIDGIELSLEKE